jgi:NADPH-dependent 2,4-dienoyl-CoA reductase/sulfur reductase-like enzyme
MSGEEGVMVCLTRRRFTSLAGVSLAAATSPLFAPTVLGQAKPRMVVVGGGPGGGTVARAIAAESAGAVDVTLIEPQRKFTTCFFSNVYLGGFRDLDSITHGYETLARGGVRLVHDWARSIDRQRKLVVLAGGARVPYDRLVVAPGIDLKWESVPGYSEAAADTMPHAWKAGAQTRALAQRLNALEDGALVVMIAPPNPYRCPPGPYERVSMFAHVLKTKGHKRSKIIIVDAKPNFSKQGLFMDGWERHYPGMIEWQDPKVHGGLVRVDAKANAVVTELATYKAMLVNVIPAQRAGRIAQDAALVDHSGFCPIEPETMRSKMDASVFVVGDACIPGDMPKSAFSANSQAKVAAMTIRSELTNSRAFPARYSNTCWSLIAPDDDVKVGGTYEPGDGKIKQASAFVSQRSDTVEVRKQNYRESVDWYAAIVGDVFG